MRADPPLGPHRRRGLGPAGAQRVARRIDDARLVAVIRPRLASGRALAARRGASVLHSVEAMLSESAVDAIVVATPSGVPPRAVVPALDQVSPSSPRSRSPGPSRRAGHGRRGRAHARRCAVGYQWRAAGRVRPGPGSRVRISILLSEGVGSTQARPCFGDARPVARLIAERASQPSTSSASWREVRAVQATRGDVPARRDRERRGAQGLSQPASSYGSGSGTIGTRPARLGSASPTRPVPVPACGGNARVLRPHPRSAFRPPRPASQVAPATTGENHRSSRRCAPDP